MINFLLTWTIPALIVTAYILLVKGKSRIDMFAFLVAVTLAIQLSLTLYERTR